MDVSQPDHGAAAPPVRPITEVLRVAWMLIIPASIVGAFVAIPAVFPGGEYFEEHFDVRIVMYVALLIGSIPVFTDRRSGLLRVKFGWIRLAVCMIYLLVEYWVLFFVAISLAGILYGRYL